MSIVIDQRSDHSAFIEVGNITVYVEHSSAAPEHIHIWRNENEEIKKQAYIFKSDAWVSSLDFGNNSCLLCGRPALLYMADK